MPELPEVDAVVRRLREAAEKARVESVVVERAGTVAPQGMEEIGVVAGRRMERVWRRAKYILMEFSGGVYLRVHLRMTGNLYVLPDWRLRPVGARVWWRLSDGRVMIYEDPRALGRVHVVGWEEIEALDRELGPEPLGEEFTVGVLREILRGVKAPVKPVLMDQRRVAGIGNIYASEALWWARIHPGRPAGEVAAGKVKVLHGAIRKVLEHAVGSAYAEYTQPGKMAESESFGVEVYGREGEGCSRCGTGVERMVQGGRSTFYCRRCQAW